MRSHFNSHTDALTLQRSHAWPVLVEVDKRFLTTRVNSSPATKPEPSPFPRCCISSGDRECFGGMVPMLNLQSEYLVRTTDANEPHATNGKYRLEA
jgi:hypothetical protein